MVRVILPMVRFKKALHRMLSSTDIERRKKLYLIASIVLGATSTILAIVALYLATRHQAVPLSTDTPETTTIPPVVAGFRHFNPLNGRGEEYAPTTRRFVTAMIDNHPDARPQEGLESARIVYEVPVEGSFTRYMAVFDRMDSVASVGPIRSARPYFVTLASEYALPLYLHSGGSPEALQMLRKGAGVQDINEFYWGNYFSRNRKLFAPHNLFTSSSAWQKIFERETETTERVFTPWKFLSYSSATDYDALAPFTASSSAARALTVTYNRSYAVDWTYDIADGMYLMSRNGVNTSTTASGTLKATTIIVQFTSIASVDEEDRKEVVLEGSGRAMVMSRGRRLDITWKKENGRTMWYDDAGMPLTLVPGLVWVHVVPQGTRLEISN